MTIVCYNCEACGLHVHVGEYEDDDPSLRECPRTEDKQHKHAECKCECDGEGCPACHEDF